jgi:hypothetical protein
MTLYSKNNSYPKSLPNRIRLASGATRTDSSTFTAEEIAAAGYILAPEKPEVTYPNKLDWDGNNWSVRAPNETETLARWEEIKQQCIILLSETDYKVIKSVETGVPVDTAYVAYRQELRDIYNNVNNIDPWNVQWPSKPVGDNNAA